MVRNEVNVSTYWHQKSKPKHPLIWMHKSESKILYDIISTCKSHICRLKMHMVVQAVSVFLFLLNNWRTEWCGIWHWKLWIAIMCLGVSVRTLFVYNFHFPKLLICRVFLSDQCCMKAFVCLIHLFGSSVSNSVENSICQKNYYS